MVQTRAQARREQPSRLVAPLGVHSPQRWEQPLQADGGHLLRRPAAVDVEDDNVLGGRQSSSARGTSIEYRRGGGGKARSSPGSSARKSTQTRRSKEDKEEDLKPKKCGHKQCRTCVIYNEEEVIINHNTGKKERIMNDRKCRINCGTENVIYLLECNSCGIQYVGETSQKLNARFSDHKSRIRNNKHNDKRETYLVQHFNQGACKGATYSCRIIQTVDRPAKIDNKLDPVATKYRRTMEDKWIAQLQTLYPYGLNNRMGKNSDQRKEDEPVKVLLQPRRRKRNRKRRSRPNKNKEVILAENVYDEITGSFTQENDSKDTAVINSAIVSARKKIPRMKKKEVKRLGMMALEDIGGENVIPRRILHVIVDLTKSKMQDNKIKQNPVKRKKDILAFVVRYKNHGTGMIDMKSIMRKKKTHDSIPFSVMKKEESPMIVYKYENTVRNKIFNYKATAEEYKKDDEKKMTCECEQSDFKDPHHGHVVTGDLRIVDNIKLRNLFKKGPNYREPKFINWKKTEECLKEDINTFISKWSTKNRISETCYLEWKNIVIQQIEERVMRLKKRTKYVPRKSVLEECKEELEDLKKKYVLVPVDKAANNIGLVCKKFYLEVLNKELTSDTYDIYEDSMEFTLEHLRKESQLLGIEVDSCYKELPCIHATIKMHKDPIKFRFIIGSRLGIMKPAARMLVEVLKLVMSTHRKYCDKIRLFTGIERNWIIDSNVKFLEDIEKVNQRRAARNVKMGDFSTLYTGINQEDLKEKLKLVTDKAFKGGTNQYIRVGKQANWSSGKGCFSGGLFDKDRVHRLIDFVVDNSYFRLGNQVYHQCIGIPMGIDPAPQMANLYLYYYEYIYMEKLTVDDYGKAVKFNKTRRFIDDIGTINNDGLLMQEKGNIYPKELVLNEENVNDKEGTFLDIALKIDCNKIISKTYDKRDDYKFEIVNYPDLSGNIPQGDAYGVYISQTLRYARVCCRKEEFMERMTILTGKLISKGYEKPTLKKTLRKCMERHPWIIRKYAGFKVCDLL